MKVSLRAFHVLCCINLIVLHYYYIGRNHSRYLIFHCCVDMLNSNGTFTSGIPRLSMAAIARKNEYYCCIPNTLIASHGRECRVRVADRELAEDTSVEQHMGRTALLRAQKVSSVPIMETDKPISTYMTLPASQYSVLDAKKIERIDEDTFVCYVGGINFLGVCVEPVLTLSVIVGDRGPTVRMLEVRLEGSKAAERVNEKFSATMENIVEWQEEEQGGKLICSNTTLEIVAQVPGWFVIPVHIVERTGSKIMQKVLDTAVPRFLAQLEQDYIKWSVGEDRNTQSPS